MYEIVYSKKNKKLKDDKRLKYYTFIEVLSYPETIRIALFAIFYTSSSGLNIELAHPFGDNAETWPFERYAEGAFSGLFCIVAFSDCLF